MRESNDGMGLRHDDDGIHDIEYRSGMEKNCSPDRIVRKIRELCKGEKGDFFAFKEFFNGKLPCKNLQVALQFSAFLDRKDRLSMTTPSDIPRIAKLNELKDLGLI